MIRGLPASVLLHVGVIGFGYIAFPYTNPPYEEQIVVPVDLVNIGEVNNLRQIVEREEPDIEAEPEPALEDFLDDVDTLPEEVAPEVEETPPPPEEAPPPPPVEEDPLPPEPEDEPEPEEDEPEPEPEPEEPKPEPQKIVPPEPETDALDDLLSDSNLFSVEEKEPVRAPAPNTPVLREETSSADARRGAGERTGNTARIEALLLAQMKGCWRTVEDKPDPERLVVTVTVNLAPDGRLAKDVELISPRRARLGDRDMQVAIDRALAAARRCQPYQLPADDYAEWAEVTITFRQKN
ncbi:MAG: cell envelope integrity protein TolA [Pseudomonadota bacterium]